MTAMAGTTGQSEVGRLRHVLVKHARDAFCSDKSIQRQWKALNYFSPPQLGSAQAEFERFIECIRVSGARISFLPAQEKTGMDSLYARDAAIVCDRGLIICNMGKAARRHEPEALAATCGSLGVPILGSISGQGRIEGGDLVWLDEKTLLVGRGYRTNDAGIAQLRVLLADGVDELVVVPLPHWRGQDDVFHLMSILSPIDRDLALVYSPLMPVVLREMLLARGIELVEVPDSEFASMGSNVLALAPRQCLMLDGNPETRRRLEMAGAEVQVYAGDHISRPGAGGPTCLTRPLLRDR